MRIKREDIIDKGDTIVVIFGRGILRPIGTCYISTKKFRKFNIIQNDRDKEDIKKFCGVMSIQKDRALSRVINEVDGLAYYSHRSNLKRGKIILCEKYKYS